MGCLGLQWDISIMGLSWDILMGCLDIWDYNGFIMGHFDRMFGFIMGHFDGF